MDEVLWQAKIHPKAISITIGKIHDSRFQIHLIPETLKTTNLDNLVFGDEVNLEIDQSTIVIVDTTERILKNKT